VELTSSWAEGSTLEKFTPMPTWADTAMLKVIATISNMSLMCVIFKKNVTQNYKI
jgi:hypothetical protein